MNGLIGLVILVLDIIALVDIIKSTRPLGSKVLWILLVCFLPVFGMIAYYLLAKKKTNS